jgi:hypothetical protein
MEHTAPAWALWVEHSVLGEAARHSWWLYPLCGVLHLIGLGLLVGSILALDLRLLGLSGRLELAAMARHLLPMTLIGFCLSATTGAVLFSADASHLIGNKVFLAKLCLIVLAGANAGLFHHRAFRALLAAGAAGAAQRHARWAAALSIGLWVGVVSLGRLIAYF